MIDLLTLSKYLILVEKKFENQVLLKVKLGKRIIGITLTDPNDKEKQAIFHVEITEILVARKPTDMFINFIHSRILEFITTEKKRIITNG